MDIQTGYIILFSSLFITTLCVSIAFIFVPNFMYPDTYSFSDNSNAIDVCDWNVTPQQSMVILAVGIGCNPWICICCYCIHISCMC